MSQLDVEQELERLFRATREGTEPDAAARARIRAGLAVKLVPVGAPPLARGGLSLVGGSRWLVAALAGALLGGWMLLQASRPPAPQRLAAPAASVTAAAQVVSVAPPAAVPSSAPEQAPVALAAPLEPAKVRLPPKPEEPGAELALVSAMQEALRSGNRSRALALADEHARRFPAGVLAQERESTRAIARCQLASATERDSIQGMFTQRFPRSPYAARVEAACAH